VESLTDGVEAAATRLIEQIDEMGGAVAAIEQGFQKAEIERSAYQVQLEIDSGERTVVGVNKFTTDEREHYEPLRVNPAIEQEQGDRLARLRAERDNDEVQRLLQAIRDAAAGPDNLLYPMKEALRAHATVGEVSDALRDVWGQYTPTDAF
jgi:methylmalonyl-CoA mutase N-terminal domain/subunit